MYIYETIHEMVNTLDNKKKKLFVYMLLTRQKNVYDYLAENKMWDQREQIENIFQKFLYIFFKTLRMRSRLLINAL